LSSKRVLFFSGSIGLGHVGRDLSIARELRKRCPGVDLAWLAAPPADRVIREAGENLLADADDLADASLAAESAASGGALSLVRYAAKVKGHWSRNVAVVGRVTRRERFDLLIGDETYEISLAYRRDPAAKTCPFAMIYDFVGFDALSRSLLERFGVYLLNCAWAVGNRKRGSAVDLSLFVGEASDVPDTPFGFLLPRDRRAWAMERYNFVGPVLTFDPGDYADREEVRRRLGYGAEPLIICAVGGTAIGKEMLDLCARSFPLLRESIPGLRMILVCGPRLSLEGVDLPEGIERRGYVPALYEHLAASDLAIVQGGGTATLELTALRRPFIYFPIEGHSEQQIHVAGRLERLGAGLKMELARTTAGLLAKAVLAEIGRPILHAPVPVDGARRAAGLIGELLEKQPACVR